MRVYATYSTVFPKKYPALCADWRSLVLDIVWIIKEISVQSGQQGRPFSLESMIVLNKLTQTGLALWLKLSHPNSSSVIGLCVEARAGECVHICRQSAKLLIQRSMGTNLTTCKKGGPFCALWGYILCGLKFWTQEKQKYYHNNFSPSISLFICHPILLLLTFLYVCREVCLSRCSSTWAICTGTRR